MRCNLILSFRPGLARTLPALLFPGLALLVPDPAFAADNIFGAASPLATFINFITGIFAYMLVIVGVVVTLGGLILGSDMSGFSRRAPLVVISGAVLILADTMVTTLFTGSQGYELPPSPPAIMEADGSVPPDPQRAGRAGRVR